MNPPADTVTYVGPSHEQDHSLPPEQQQRLMAILDDYVDRLGRGMVPDEAEIIASHPELAEKLHAYFDSLSLLNDAAAGRPREPEIASETDSGLPGRIGDYTILREIGRGGMGVVYEAKEISLERRVALKVLPFAAVLDPKQTTRFRHEAQAAAQLHHGNIVPVYSVGCERGVHYYAMQFIDGQSLDVAIDQLRCQYADPPHAADRDPGATQAPGLRDDPHAASQVHHRTCSWKALSTAGSHRTTSYIRTVAALGIQIADALQHAHDYGIIHRDVKPSNLLLDHAGKVWLTDFGLARIQSENTLTLSGDVLGTVRYMSPEQAAGRAGWVDHRTDIYSLGITLYELLTLHDVFEGADPQEFLRRIEKEEPRPPRRLNSAIPVDLETVLLKAIAKAPQQRYNSAQEMADDLRRFLEGKPTLARRPNLADRLGKWAMRHLNAVLAATLVLLATAIGLGVAIVIIAGLHAETETAKETAEIHFRQAREAVERFGTGLADELARLPGSAPLRKRILLQVRQYHEQFVKHAASDPQLQSDLASSHFWIGKITEDTGDTDESLAAYARALGAYAELIRRQPEVDRYRADSALCHNNMALLHLRRGHVDDARAALQQALDVQTELVRRHADQPAYRFELALTYGNLALLCAKTEALPEAIAAFEKAIKHKTDLVHRFPDRPEFRSSLAVTLLNLSGILIQSDPHRARDGCQQAIAIHRQLADSHADDLDYSRDLALGLSQLGALQRGQRALDQAEQSYRAAVEIGQRLALRAPSNTDFRCELAGSRSNLGQALLDLGRPHEALAQFESARELIQQLRVIDARDVRYVSALGGVLNNLGTALLTLGRTDEALSAYRQAVDTQRAAVQAAPHVARFREFLDNHLANLAEAQRQASRPAGNAAATTPSTAKVTEPRLP